jgi:hypothetical protein
MSNHSCIGTGARTRHSEVELWAGDGVFGITRDGKTAKEAWVARLGIESLQCYFIWG